MQDFDDLVGVVERLLAPDGCPWDREQTLASIRPFLIEEVYEIVEAIDLDENELISEEIGDVLFQLVFLCKLAERDGRFTLHQSLQKVTEKLIRRHPHIFGEKQLKSVDEVLEQWDEIKKGEAGKSSRKSALDDIPKDLPGLARAQKMINKIRKTEFELPKPQAIGNVNNEDELGKALMNLVQHASEKGLNAKHALLKQLALLEKQFRHWEKNKID